jgi:hypothetical protein
MRDDNSLCPSPPEEQSNALRSFRIAEPQQQSCFTGVKSTITMISPGDRLGPSGENKCNLLKKMMIHNSATAWSERRIALKPPPPPPNRAVSPEFFEASHNN